METGDESLVALALQGDGEAFTALVTRHYDLIFRVAFRILGSRDAAMDLAQDICAALPGKLAGFRREARFTTWLYRVVSNAALDHLRRRKAHAKAAEGWAEAESLARDADAERQRELDWLHQAMARLAPDLRQTVALVLGEEMTHAEAARVLDISEGTVSWRMSEVKKALRRMAQAEDPA
ncbi:MAG: sigma-70 family RNA polymerase sigma factor [Rhodobacteraceae bacterium]|nr:sigma-70 family RNA polymerase sigma factor [Paracoccaceae bacterium]MCB1369150.1 sigma-70 family RNA polymerase sigma factor [Paracoccaceae bacterium]